MMSEDKDTKEVPEAESVETAEVVEESELAEETDRETEATEESAEEKVDDGELEEADEDTLDDSEDRELTDPEKVKLLTGQLSSASEKYMRLRADLDNFRKRRAREMDDLRRNTRIDTLDQVLPVMDQFQMAVSAMQDSSDTETIKQGMEMILNTFSRCFENLGVEQVSTVGEEFDPIRHEAIATEASDEVEAEFIISEWKAGYKLGEHLFRPAVVVVSSGPADATEKADEDEDANAKADGDGAEAEVEEEEGRISNKD